LFREGIPAAVKLHRTLLVRDIETTHTALQAAIASPETQRLANDFAYKNQREARAKALVKLKAVFSGATFQWASCDKPSVACWAFAKIRDAKAYTDAADHPRERQKCASIYYLCVGRLANGVTLSTGHFGLSASWHCLARLVSPERSPLAATPLRTLFIAHKVLLRASAGAVFQHRDNFLLAIGDDGALLCNALPADIDGIATVFVTAHTWLADYMGTSSYPRIPPATERDDALSSFWLCPPPVRKRLGESIQVPSAMIEAFAQ
jgi:hypothetical protein